MAYKVTDELIIEGAHLLRGPFMNFSGEATKYNRAGKRNFCVEIEDEEWAKKLKDDGWNIKTLDPRDDDELPVYYLNVEVSFENIPPSVYLVTSRKKTRLKENAVSMLDSADLKNVDLIIRPYNWEVNDKSGVKAYLKTGYFTIVEDALASKYDDITEDDNDLPF